MKSTCLRKVPHFLKSVLPAVFEHDGKRWAEQQVVVWTCLLSDRSRGVRG